MLKQLANNSIKVAALALVGANAYSRLLIEHDMALPPALDAPLHTFATRKAGLINYYLAEPSGKSAKKSAPPLVLIHSVNAAASAIEVKPLFEHYRSGRKVYAIDLPGFGLSNRDERDYTPDLFAEVINEFLEGVVDGEADVVALSLGCEFVARAAVNRPDLFRSLVFLSPTGFTTKSDENNSERASSSGQSNTAYRLLSSPLWSQPLYDLIASRPSLRYFLKKSFADGPPQELIEYGYKSSHQPNAKNVPLYFLSGRLFTSEIRQTFYRQVTTPTLVLYNQDPFVGFGELPQLLAINSAWHAERIAGTYGLPHWEKPADVTASMDRFWREKAA